MNKPANRRPRVPVHGVLLLDKSVDLSSNDVVIRAKRLLNAQKAGHTGTLDPFATGLLPVCFGEATKFSQDLLEADKSYRTVLHLGLTTNTGDTEGEVLERKEVTVSLPQIMAALEHFKGDILQVPPMYSALKRDGKPLYEYARAGVTLEREARPVTIHELDFVSYEAPFLTLQVKCSKGTYIRVLGEDIGRLLGCGAHLNALRRTRVGHLTLEHAITLEALAGMSEVECVAQLAPVDALLSTFPKILLNDVLSTRFLHGQRLALAQQSVLLPETPGRVRVYRETDGQLLGSAQLQTYGILAPERLIAKQA
jgi:tRNA pseudouridine55 synthase